MAGPLSVDLDGLDLGITPEAVLSDLDYGADRRAPVLAEAKKPRYPVRGAM